jgi:hypothetical protein
MGARQHRQEQSADHATAMEKRHQETYQGPVVRVRPIDATVYSRTSSIRPQSSEQP